VRNACRLCLHVPRWFRSCWMVGCVVGGCGRVSYSACAAFTAPSCATSPITTLSVCLHPPLSNIPAGLPPCQVLSCLWHSLDLCEPSLKLRYVREHVWHKAHANVKQTEHPKVSISRTLPCKQPDRCSYNCSVIRTLHDSVFDMMVSIDGAFKSPDLKAHGLWRCTPISDDSGATHQTVAAVSHTMKVGVLEQLAPIFQVPW
jgi:hypothetical protein